MSSHNMAQASPTHASGFYYLLWVQLPQQVTVELLLSQCNKESRSERVGLYWSDQGRFACLALLKIALCLHQ
jgi:hypothetical protein